MVKVKKFTRWHKFLNAIYWGRKDKEPLTRALIDVLESGYETRKVRLRFEKLVRPKKEDPCVGIDLTIADMDALCAAWSAIRAEMEGGAQ